MKKLFFTAIIILGAFLSKSQDTISVLQYNLLNYGNNTDYCDQNNNNIDTKNENIRILLQYYTPDIISVNEMVNDSYKAIYLLNNALNTDGRTFYKNVAMTNLSGSDIVNMLYYDKRKFTLEYQEAVATSLRDINIYHFYYNSPDLQNGDTVRLVCISAHLKAGSYSSDAATRADMTSTLMNYLKNHNIDGNVIMMGDFNLYSSSEEAYQNIVNYSVETYRLYDPVNMSGDWSNNSYYRMYHSQSTHYSSGCYAGGGLDDRFDFILISQEIRDDIYKIKYIPDSYKVIGQDGQHFNAALTDAPENSMYPQDLVQALYNISDHLPVTLKLRIDQTPVIGVQEQETNEKIFVSTLVKNQISVELPGTYNYTLSDITGKPLKQGKVNQKDIIPVDNLKPGIYFLNLKDNNKPVKTFKIVKY